METTFPFVDNTTLPSCPLGRSDLETDLKLRLSIKGFVGSFFLLDELLSGSQIDMEISFPDWHNLVGNI
jgi:hypothetical protein